MKNGWNDTLLAGVATTKLIVSPFVTQVKPAQASDSKSSELFTDLELFNFDQTYEFPEWDNPLSEKLLGRSYGRWVYV